MRSAAPQHPKRRRSAAWMPYTASSFRMSRTSSSASTRWTIQMLIEVAQMGPNTPGARSVVPRL
eukprot:759969-Pyramimonas_sp.AAC.1